MKPKLLSVLLTRLALVFFSLIQIVCHAGTWTGFTTYSHDPEALRAAIETGHRMGMPITRLSIIHMDYYKGKGVDVFKHKTVEEIIGFLSWQCDLADQGMERAAAQQLPMKLVICLWNALGEVQNQADEDPNNHRDMDLENLNGKTTQAWRYLMTRYKNNPRVVGYDIINEPRAKGAVLSRFYYHMINLQAAVGSQKTLFFQPQLGNASALPDFSAGFLAKAKELNHYISPHIYYTGRITYQTPDKPLAYTNNEKAIIYNYLDKAEAHRQRYGYRIWVGECSCVWNSGWTLGVHNQRLWARDVLAYFKAKGWEWCWHDANRGSAWSPFILFGGTLNDFTLNSPTAAVLRLNR